MRRREKISPRRYFFADFGVPEEAITHYFIVFYEVPAETAGFGMALAISVLPGVCCVHCAGAGTGNVEFIGKEL
ncbi:hypothetical protein UR09_03380 [Candidatus Nitromaritima sp. SCGC AAA799-A02]|nr:hypothetical protein UR09_03380 [Candidatus Nitromaritima sp. SCGC AAA799-A02]